MSRNSTNRAEDVMVVDTTKLCVSHLEDLSLKLQANKEGLPKEDIELFRDDIANILKELYTTQYNHYKTNEVIQSVLGTRKSTDEHSFDDIKQDIKKRIKDAGDSYDVTKEAEYVRVTSILKGDADDLDADFVMIDKGLTDNDIKCPYTAQIFKEPMKNLGGPQQPKCIHHVSKEALNIMCSKANVAKCPTPGCTGKWSKATAVLDEAFERRVQKYLTAKNVEQQAGLSNSQSSNVEDYTQL